MVSSPSHVGMTMIPVGPDNRPDNDRHGDDETFHQAKLRHVDRGNPVATDHLKRVQTWRRDKLHKRAHPVSWNQISRNADYLKDGDDRPCRVRVGFSCKRTRRCLPWDVILVRHFEGL